MEITIRDVDKYKDVRINHDRTEIDLGLFNGDELLELIITLKDALEKLES